MHLIMKPELPPEIQRISYGEAWLTVINSEKGPGVVSVFLVPTRDVFGEEVQCLVSAMT